MTQSIVNVTEARDNLSELLGRVKFGEEVVTIEKKGKPYAIIISPEEYNRYKDIARKALAATIEQIQARNRAANLEKVMEDVTKAVEDVRQARYAGGK